MAEQPSFSQYIFSLKIAVFDPFKGILNRAGYVQLTIMGVYRRRTPNTPNS